MIPLISHPFLLAPVLCLVVISGCIEAEVPDDDSSWPDTATLEAPMWSPGDYWKYEDDYGRWINFTVDAIEKRNGTTYRVVVETNEPNRFGGSEMISWVDVETLGVVEFQDEEGFQGRFDPPKAQLFPMVNRTYTYTNQFSNGYQLESEAEYRVYGWSEINTPAGTFQGIEVRTDDTFINQSVSNGSFAPVVGNYAIQKNGEQVFRLAVWSYAASPD